MFRRQFQIKEYFCDIRDSVAIKKVFVAEKPEVIFHLAAEAIVSKCQRDPLRAIEVNVMGTANILDSLQSLSYKKTIIFVTTDKVYLSNNEGNQHFENDKLGGNEIYSASKSASEMIIQGFTKSFFEKEETDINVAVVRAGNVLGGGDWGEDRLVPDFYRALKDHRQIELRNPTGIRPWQHVLDVIHGYILLAEFVHSKKAMQGSTWNFSNPKLDFTVEELINALSHSHSLDKNFVRIAKSDQAFKEEKFLAINSDKAKNTIGFNSYFGKVELVESLSHWYSAYINGHLDVLEVSNTQLTKHIAWRGNDDK
jgi:CDP-glucose 4,6-dehydratase